MTPTLRKELHKKLFDVCPCGNPTSGVDQTIFSIWIDENFISKEEYKQREMMIRAQEEASAEQDMTFYKVRVLEAIGEDQEPAEDGWVITLGVQNAERNKLRSELKQKLGLV